MHIRLATLGAGLAAGLLAPHGCTEGTDPAVAVVVEVSPPETRLRVGDALRLAVAVRDRASGAEIEERIRWSSSDTRVATVDSAGAVVGVGPGSALIVARVRGVADTAGVWVRQVASTVETSLQSATIPPGDTVRLGAVALDQTGAPIPEAPILWASSDTSTAVVDSTGLVRGRREGNASITATTDERSAVVPLEVAPPFVLVGAGDIAYCYSKGDEATAALLDQTPGMVFTTGDNAYPNGTDAEFADCYGPSWGRHKARTRPTPGNHEYYSGGGGYFRYFGHLAGESGTGYYSYRLGDWHIIALNSEIDVRAGSSQEQWLRAELAASDARCTLAYWHRPLFSSGWHGSDGRMKAIWKTLYDAGADVVLSGHDHVYERFAPQRADGTVDPERGIRQFIIGTGGSDLRAFGATAANSEVRHSESFGVLKLTLHSYHYAWEFIPVAGAAFTDAGTDSCH